MKPLNTLPIEQFLDKARVAIRSNNRHITFDAKEIQALHDSLAVVMARIAGMLDAQIAEASTTTISVKMDGGGFNS